MSLRIPHCWPSLRHRMILLLLYVVVEIVWLYPASAFIKGLLLWRYASDSVLNRLRFTLIRTLHHAPCVLMWNYCLWVFILVCILCFSGEKCSISPFVSVCLFAFVKRVNGVGNEILIALILWILRNFPFLHNFPCSLLYHPICNPLKSNEFPRVFVHPAKRFSLSWVSTLGAEAWFRCLCWYAIIKGSLWMRSRCWIRVRKGYSSYGQPPSTRTSI